jgi:hypothetical protein
MGADELTDARIHELLSMKKHLKSSPSPKPKMKGMHEERDIIVESEDEKERFVVYARQNTKLPDDFSCGLRWEAPSGESVHLMRVNGSSHVHPNRIEQTTIVGKCHIHVATARYILAGYHAEAYAEEASEYSDPDGALRVLADRCNISGFRFEPHQGLLSM